MEKHLEVKRSSLPGSGKGLFTKTAIPKGTRIVEYKGKVSSWKDADHADGNNGYIFYASRNHVIDAMKYPKALARYANDGKGLSKVKGITNNSEYVHEGRKVFIDAVRNIPAGSEILVSYGKEYWDVIKHNLKLQEKERRNKAKSKK